MKYRELLQKLQTLPEGCLDDDVTIAVEDGGGIEFHAATDFVGENGKWPTNQADREAMFVEEAGGVLDDDHAFITLLL